MKYWYMYYSNEKKIYQLTNDSECNWLSQFKSFDMAYEYVTRMNYGHLPINSYSRWTQR